MGKQIEKFVGEGLQSGKTKSKWFSRLMVLAMGLVLSVGSIIGAVMLVSDSQSNGELGQASVMQSRYMAIGDYIQNFGGRKWRVIGFDTNGSITGMPGAPLLRTDSLEAPHPTLLGDNRGNRFHSSNVNFWATSELRSFLNNRADLGAGNFSAGGFLSNFSAAESAAIIPNVRLETIRTNAGVAARYTTALAAGQIEAIVDGAGWAASPTWATNSGIAGGNGHTHGTSHRYVHRDTVFILDMQQTQALDNLGLRYANSANALTGSSGWSAGSQALVGYNFMWPRMRDNTTGNANRQAALSWLRSPDVAGSHNVCILWPRSGRVDIVDASATFANTVGVRSFAPALYISPSKIFRVARNSDSARNEQAGFRVFELTEQAPNAATNATISGGAINWAHAQGAGAPVSGFDIMRGTQVIASVGAAARSFDLNRVPGNVATGTQVGAYRALAVGAHTLSVVAVGQAGVRAGASNSVVYNREARVSSITITTAAGAPTMASLGVSWPRPTSIEQMPSVQLVANVAGFYGSNLGVTWSSNRHTIATVDPLSGYVRAAWPEDMWAHSMLADRSAIITARSVVSNNVVGTFVIQIIFDDPTYAWAAGVTVDNAGARQIELAACGTTLLGGGSLANVTQFFASAYGYNMLAGQRGVTWDSSDMGVAVIDRYTGMLSAVGAGITRITATSVVAPNVPSSFYVSVTRDGTAVATSVTIFCDDNQMDERRLIIPYTEGASLPFVDLRAVVDGYNITTQVAVWTSSCGASLGVPSAFLSLSLTADGVRVTGLAQGGVFIITASPAGATGAVGEFRIFVDRAVAPNVSDVVVSVPSSSNLILPVERPIAAADLPRVQLTAATTGVGGGAGSAVLWTVYPLGFVTLVVDHINPNVVSVVAVDRGQVGFAQEVTITATSLISQDVSASRSIVVMQAAVKGIEVSVALGGAGYASLFLPYGASSVYERQAIDLRAVVAVSHASVSQAVRWYASVAGAVMFDNARTQAGAMGLDSIVTVRPLGVGLVTITARGVYCGSVSNQFVIEIVQAGPTSVRIVGPVANESVYQMSISLPRPDALQLPTAQLGASVGGSFAAANSLVWTSSCGGGVVEFLGATVGNLVLVRGIGAGVAVITATHPQTTFYAQFTIAVDVAALYSVEIFGDGVVRGETAMLIPLVYSNGVYALPEFALRQMLELSLAVSYRGAVSTQFVWTISDTSVIRFDGFDSDFDIGGEYEYGYEFVTDASGLMHVRPFGVGRAVVRVVSTLDASVYAEFTIFVTRGTASCSIQDEILDLPQVQDGYVRLILVCEHYFGSARMSHRDMAIAEALEFALPMLTIGVVGAEFLGWSLSRGGALLPVVAVGGSEEDYDSESGGVRYQILIPAELFNGADTILLFAVWYIPYVPSESGGSNLARNIIIGTLGVAGVGAAGTAGYIAQSRLRKRRDGDVSEWGMD